jgi:hypothetical protein
MAALNASSISIDRFQSTSRSNSRPRSNPTAAVVASVSISRTSAPVNPPDLYAATTAVARPW